MPGLNEHIEGFFFWDADGSGANAISAYQCVSLATAAEVAAAIAAGNCPARIATGNVVVRTPVSGGAASRPIVGVTKGSAFSLGSIRAEMVPVVVDGVAEVQMAGAQAFDPLVLLTCTTVETRTDKQTPFTNNTAFDQRIPVDPAFSLTYQMALAGALTINPASGATANAPYYPLGYLLDAATAKYDRILVDLQRVPRVLYA